MANTKSVAIQGIIPFDAGDNESMLRYLGQLNAPLSGLRIYYEGFADPVKNSELPNFDPEKAPANGDTAMVHFRISGRDSVSWGWLDKLNTALDDVGARISIWSIKDVEGQ